MHFQKWLELLFIYLAVYCGAQRPPAIPRLSFTYSFVVLCVHKTPDAYLDATVYSLLRQRGATARDWELVIAGIERPRFDALSQRHAATPLVFADCGNMTLSDKNNCGIGRASNDVVVVVHDYIKFNPGFIAAVERYPDPWDVAAIGGFVDDAAHTTERTARLIPTRIFTAQVAPWSRAENPAQGIQPWTLLDAQQKLWFSDLPEFQNRFVFCPQYLQLSLVGGLATYQNGNAVMAKRSVFRRFPYADGIEWGGGEDIQWAATVNRHFRLHIIPGTCALSMKKHGPPYAADLSFSTALQMVKRGLAWFADGAASEVPAEPPADVPCL